MIQEAILHLPHGAFAYALTTQQAIITLRAGRGDVEACTLVHEDRYQAPDTYGTVPMAYVGSDDLFDYFQATVDSSTRRIRYRFLLEDGVKRLWYGERGFSERAEWAGWFQLAYLTTRDQFAVPDWVDEAVVYQIFPDRFHNGNRANDPENVCAWGERPTAKTFFGGDLSGITEKLPYLQELGVNLIYLTPVFLSPSTHKYDTCDYMQIDPMFGDLESCKQLVAAAHKRGIRIVFDAVFNHCGSQFAPFRDVLEKGAQSEYAEWFHIREFPVDVEAVNYETFSVRTPSMPKLRTEHPDVRRYLLSVAEYWIKEVGIDGWRLDVANEVDHAFWRAFRETVRAANPQALIIGEVWHDATAWLQGDQFDGVTNYLFRDAVVSFFAKQEIDAAQFDAALTKTRMMYKAQANRSMFNLLGSHDTERFLTLCQERTELMRLAVIFQMTYVGIPQVYYGDEIGMVGGNDPDCRRTMIWEEAGQNQELLALHKRLIALRKQHAALQSGHFRTVRKDPLHNVYAYLRENAEERILVLLNNSKFAQAVTLPAGQHTDLLTAGQLTGERVLPAYGAYVLLLAAEADI